MPETFRLAVPELTMVTTKAGDELPTVTLPKLWLPGATEMLGTGAGGAATTVPVTFTVTELSSGSLEGMSKVSVNEPVVAVENPTSTVQLPDGAMIALEQLSFKMLNGVASGSAWATSLRTRSALPTL